MYAQVEAEPASGELPAAAQPATASNVRCHRHHHRPAPCRRSPLPLPLLCVQMPGPVSCAVVLLVTPDNKILCVLPHKHLPRPKKRGAGMTKANPKPWDAPGGKLESGETPIQAAVRELKEETGLTVDPAAVIGECYVPEGKVAVFVWHVDAELSARPLDGISQVQWLLRSELEGKACFRLSRAHTEAANKNLLTKKPKSGDVVKYGPNMTVTIA
jgi:8-oxo-dGTP diphosphatase